MIFLELDPANPQRAHVVSVLKDSQIDMALYLRNIFKRRRQPAATHVLVLMVSDERRNHNRIVQGGLWHGSRSLVAAN